MAYETYTTEALICGIFPQKEHDLTLRLFTKDAGMLFARAAGARAQVSKLRYGLQEFSHSRVTLVRGKADWRITGAVAIDNVYYRARERNARARLLSAMRTLRRLVHGAEAHTDLFEQVVESMYLLADRDDALSVELFTLRLLHHLGYVSPRDSLHALVHAPSLQHACISVGSDASTVRHIKETIENALTVSHL